MDCQEIETIMYGLTVDTIGRIRGKLKVMDALHVAHLKSIDSELMDVRIFVAKLSTGYSTTEALKMVDDFIYQKQIK